MVAKDLYFLFTNPASLYRAQGVMKSTREVLAHPGILPALQRLCSALIPCVRCLFFPVQIQGPKPQLSESERPLEPTVGSVMQGTKNV